MTNTRSLVTSLFVLLPSLAAQEAAAPADDVPAAFRERQARRAAFRNDRVFAAVRDGVGWLLAHQEADGRWDSDEFAAHDPPQAPCDGPGQKLYDVGVSALALLAVLAQADPAHLPACHRAAEWLESSIDAKGRVRTVGHEHVYQQALATMALAESARLLGRAGSYATARRSIDCLEAHRNPGAAWRYQPRDGNNDASVSSWCVAAYMACHDAGIEVPAASVGEALAWFDCVVDPLVWRTGYTHRGEPSARQPGDHKARFPVELGEAMTAAALHARLATGLRSQNLGRVCALLLDKPPAWSPKELDFYYWLHGSLAFGWLDERTARPWTTALHKALLTGQRRDGAAKGSWDPIDAWGHSGGRIYATAANVLSLSAPYRHGPLDLAAALPAQPAWRRVATAIDQGKFGEAAEHMARLPVAEHPGAAAVLADLEWRIAAGAAYGERLRALDGEAAPLPLVRRDSLRDLAAALSPHAAGTEAARAVEDMLANKKLLGELEVAQTLRDDWREYAEVSAGKNKDRRKKLADRLEKVLTRFPDTEQAAQLRSMIFRLRSHV